MFGEDLPIGAATPKATRAEVTRRYLACILTGRCLSFVTVFGVGCGRKLRLPGQDGDLEGIPLIVDTSNLMLSLGREGGVKLIRRGFMYLARPITT